MKKYITVFFISLFLFFSLPVYATEYESIRGTALITTNSLNVRSGPSKEYDKMGSLKKDTMVQVIGIVEPDWYVIEYGGEEGYVHQDYVLFTPEEENMTERGMNEDYRQLMKYLPIVIVVAIIIIMVAMVFTFLKLKSDEEEDVTVEGETIPVVNHEDTNMHLGEVFYDTYRLDIDPIYFEETTIIPQPESLFADNNHKESWIEDVYHVKKNTITSNDSIQALDSKLEEATAQIVALQKEVEELKKHKG